jgi:hypothetical protein
VPASAPRFFFWVSTMPLARSSPLLYAIFIALRLLLIIRDVQFFLVVWYAFVSYVPYSCFSIGMTVLSFSFYSHLLYPSASFLLGMPTERFGLHAFSSVSTVRFGFLAAISCVRCMLSIHSSFFSLASAHAGVYFLVLRLYRIFLN